jgi:putative YhbY family RNA-binding protein
VNGPRQSSPDATSATTTTFALRRARLEDVTELETLIAVSARALLAPWYSPAQIDAAVGSVFAVDAQLIDDGTYFVAAQGSAVVGCGGWSRRKTLFGADRGHTSDADSVLDPARDPARIRAFFVHPACVRRGIAAALMRHCEQAAADAGFKSMELVATLAGQPLYAASGFAAVEQFEIPLGGTLSMPVVRMSKNIATASQREVGYPATGQVDTKRAAVVALAAIHYTSSVLTLTSTERRALRARAHHLHPVVAIGQHGLTPSVIREIDVNLRAHELVKVRAFSDIRGEREAMLGQICAKLGAAPVQHIGKLLILWRPAPQNPPAKEQSVRTTPARGRRPLVADQGRQAENIRDPGKAGKTMAKSTPQARRPRSPTARAPARPPSGAGSSRRGPPGVPSAPASRERRRRRAP